MYCLSKAEWYQFFSNLGDVGQFVFNTLNEPLIITRGKILARWVQIYVFGTSTP